MVTPVPQQSMKCAIGIAAVALIVYSLISYWGIRSPDAEIMFRTTEAVATRGSFELSDDMVLRGFGLGTGKNGSHYSLFGPAQAIAAVPFYKLGQFLGGSGWGTPMGLSHYVDDGFAYFAQGASPPDLKPHALRAATGLFNVVVGTLLVVVFFLTARILAGSDTSAMLATVVFAFGSLLMPYSGTFFSEPMATLFVLLSLHALIQADMVQHEARHRAMWLSGLFLGLATTAHITAILFAPFFCVYGMAMGRRWSDLKAMWPDAARFSVGFGLLLALLAYYNYARFGDVFETGRTASDFTYAVFVQPWRGLWGMVAGSNKSLLLFCPAVVLGLVAWRPFHSKHRLLSYTILSAALFRLLFIATRSDWHGGFSLGPRYLVVLIPLLLLPIGEWVRELINKKRVVPLIGFGAFSFLCIAQQLYFSVGEIFSHLHFEKWQGTQAGIDVFKDDALHLSWDHTALVGLLDGLQGASLFRSLAVGNLTLWMLLLTTTAALLGSLYLFACSSRPR